MNMIEKLCAAAALALPLAGMALPAQATVLVDPTTGGAYVFGWDDLGPIDRIDGNPLDTNWSVTSLVDAVINFSVLDCCIVGDHFALVLDGITTAWDVEGVDGFGNFTAFIDVFLTAGSTYVFALDTDLGGGGFPGGGSATFGRAVPSAVPLPAAAPLLLIGLGALVGLRRRRKAA